MQIFWNNQNGELDFNRPPPFPSFNALKNKLLATRSEYVTISDNDELLSLYNNASVEITELYNKTYKEIQNLKIELQKLEKFRNQGKGKRISKNLLNRESEILEWHHNGISNREIARQLNVSEGTIRYFLKRQYCPSSD